WRGASWSICRMGDHGPNRFHGGGGDGRSAVYGSQWGRRSSYGDGRHVLGRLTRSWTECLLQEFRRAGNLQPECKDLYWVDDGTGYDSTCSVCTRVDEDAAGYQRHYSFSGCCRCARSRTGGVSFVLRNRPCEFDNLYWCYDAFGACQFGHSGECLSSAIA